jgi:hypothetical protein
MQILKLLLVLGVAVCALSARGADNQAQKKAREALEKSLQGPQTQPAPMPSEPAPAPAVTIPPQPSPVAPPPPAVATPAPAPAPEAVPTASDPEAIAKAREAMRQKMLELQPQQPAAPAPRMQPPPAATPPPPVAPPAIAVPAPPPEPPPQVQPQPVPAPTPPPAAVVEPPPAPAIPAAPQIAEPDAIAKAREAMRQKMLEIQPQAATPSPSSAAPVTQAPSNFVPPPVAAPAQPPPAAIAEPPPPAAAASDQAMDPATLAKARDAMRQKLQQVEAESPAEPETGSPSLSPGPRPAHRAPRSVMNFPKLEGPPPAISADKQQQLDSLLVKYKADQITPEQYQAERARILGAQ